MKKYSVTIVKTISLFAVVEVEAEDEVQAEEIAEDQIEFTNFDQSETTVFEVEEQKYYRYTHKCPACGMAWETPYEYKNTKQRCASLKCTFYGIPITSKK